MNIINLLTIKKRYKEKLIAIKSKILYSEKRIKELSQQATHFEKIENIRKKGISETFFINELRKIFGLFIICDVTIPNQEWDYFYLPDAVFSNGSITIDIEIDEPYIYDNFEPIHYYNIVKNKHVDSERDLFFCDNLWVVVRFTEKQVCINPLGCCKTIANIIYKLTGVDTFFNTIKEVNNPIEEYYWSFQEGQELAKQKYRNTYLNKKYFY